MKQPKPNSNYAAKHASTTGTAFYLQYKPGAGSAVTHMPHMSHMPHTPHTTTPTHSPNTRYLDIVELSGTEQLSSPWVYNGVVLIPNTKPTDSTSTAIQECTTNLPQPGTIVSIVQIAPDQQVLWQRTGLLHCTKEKSITPLGLLVQITVFHPLQYLQQKHSRIFEQHSLHRIFKILLQGYPELTSQVRAQAHTATKTNSPTNKPANDPIQTMAGNLPKQKGNHLHFRMQYAQCDLDFLHRIWTHSQLHYSFAIDGFALHFIPMPAHPATPPKEPNTNAPLQRHAYSNGDVYYTRLQYQAPQPPGVLSEYQILTRNELAWSCSASLLGLGKDAPLRVQQTIVPPGSLAAPVAPHTVVAGVMYAHIQSAQPDSNASSEPKGVPEQHPDIQDQLQYLVRFSVEYGSQPQQRFPMALDHIGQCNINLFPLLPGTPILLAFMHGNPDCPYIIGATTPELPWVVPEPLATQCGIYTYSGHRLRMVHEHQQPGHIALESAHHQQLILNDQHQGSAQLQTSHMHGLLIQNKSKKIELKSAHKEVILHMNGSLHTLAIAVQGVGTITMQAGKGICIEENGCGITLHKGGIKIACEKNMLIASKQKIEIQAERIECKAPKIRAQSTKQIRLNAQRLSLESQTATHFQTKTAAKIVAGAINLESKTHTHITTKGILKTQANLQDHKSKTVSRHKAALIFLN